MHIEGVRDVRQFLCTTCKVWVMIEDEDGDVVHNDWEVIKEVPCPNCQDTGEEIRKTIARLTRRDDGQEADTES